MSYVLTALTVSAIEQEKGGKCVRRFDIEPHQPFARHRRCHSCRCAPQRRDALCHRVGAADVMGGTVASLASLNILIPRRLKLCIRHPQGGEGGIELLAERFF